MKEVCVVSTSPEAKGGIATVVKAFYSEINIPDVHYSYIISHFDSSAIVKVCVGIKAAIQIALKCIQGGVDCFHIHSADGASFIRLALYVNIVKLFHKRVINHVHCASWDAFFRNSRGSTRKRIARIYGKCDALIALSGQWKENLSEVTKRDRIYVLENFIPNINLQHHPDFNAKNVLFMSRVETVKGTRDIPEIVRLVSDKIPNVIFEICGDGSQLQRTKEECCAQGLSKNINFNGWVDNSQKAEYLNRASLCFLPSYAEGMPMSILEGIGHCIPVVSTPVGGIPQIVRNGYNGFLCEPGNTREIADAIIKLLTDSETYERFVWNAKKIAEKHSLKVYEKDLSKIYDKVVK